VLWNEKAVAEVAHWVAGIHFAGVGKSGGFGHEVFLQR
jgi:hypothetical protein